MAKKCKRFSPLKCIEMRHTFSKKERVIIRSTSTFCENALISRKSRSRCSSVFTKYLLLAQWNASRYEDAGVHVIKEQRYWDDEDENAFLSCASWSSSLSSSVLFSRATRKTEAAFDRFSSRDGGHVLQSTLVREDWTFDRKPQRHRRHEDEDESHLN